MNKARHEHLSEHHVHSGAIHKNQKVETAHVSVKGWINKLWSIMRVCACACMHMYEMEYYSVLKRKEILTRATTWTNLEDLMLIGISQSQKTNAV